MTAACDYPRGNGSLPVRDPYPLTSIPMNTHSRRPSPSTRPRSSSAVSSRGTDFPSYLLVARPPPHPTRCPEETRVNREKVSGAASPIQAWSMGTDQCWDVSVITCCRGAVFGEQAAWASMVLHSRDEWVSLHSSFGS
jgi:hypothetical protein